MADKKIVGIFKSAKNCSCSEGHLSAGVGTESFSLEGILSFMVPNWGPPPPIPIPPKIF